MHQLRFVLACLVLSGVVHATNAQTVRPNVVILLTDDQGTLDANCYGSMDLVTPNMDKLAATGIRFTQAYSHSVCCPARAAMLTGRHPQRGGISNWTQGDRHGSDVPKINMALDEVTLAEVMKSAGYRTALFGKWHLGAKEGHGPLDQGFETFFGHLGGFIDNYRHYFLHAKGFHDLWQGNTEVYHREEYYPDMMIEKAVSFIDSNRTQPFFMMVAFNLPHYPEQPIAKFKDAYPDMPMPRKSYARVISSVDDHIGRVMAKLESTGLRDNTIVIMMSDNGHSIEDSKGIAVDDHSSGYPRGHYYLAHGGGGNTGKWIGNKGSFLEGGIRVPAIISYPALIPQGQVCDQIVTTMDWFPTVQELCGIQPDANAPKLDGRSMKQIIVNPEAPSAHQILHFAWAKNWAVRENDWKLICKLDLKTGKEILSLHNLAEGSPEVIDHAQDQPAKVKDLVALHAAWERDVNNK